MKTNSSSAQISYESHFDYIVRRYLENSRLLANSIVLFGSALCAGAFALLKISDLHPLTKIILVLSLVSSAISLWSHLFYVYNTKRYTFGCIIGYIHKLQPDKAEQQRLKSRYTDNISRFNRQISRYGRASSRCLMMGAVFFLVAILTTYLPSEPFQTQVSILSAESPSRLSESVNEELNRILGSKDVEIQFSTAADGDQFTYIASITYKKK
jgi:hypothetical protein